MIKSLLYRLFGGRLNEAAVQRSYTFFNFHGFGDSNDR